MTLVSMVYLVSVLVLLVEVPLWTVRSRRRSSIMKDLGLAVIRLVVVVVPFSLVALVLTKVHGLQRGSWWIPYCQLFGFFLVVIGVGVLLNRYLNPARSVFILHVLLLFSTLGVFWIAPVLEHLSRGPDVASALLYMNPLLFAAKPLAVDVFRMPFLYGRTPLSQMFVRYPDPLGCILIFCVLSFILTIAAYAPRRKSAENRPSS